MDSIKRNIGSRRMEHPPQGEFMEMVSPLAFNVNVADGRKYNLGDQGFNFVLADGLFAPSKALQDKSKCLSVDDELALSQVYELCKEKYANWCDMIPSVNEILDSVSGSDRGALLEFLPKVFDPSDPQLFDGGVNEAFRSFGFYEKLPGVLDATIRSSYPNLAQNITELFNILPESSLIDEFVRLNGRYPKPDEYAGIREKSSKEPVELAGDKPSEFIEDIQYRKNGNHYVVELTCRLRGGGTRNVILKSSDTMWDEYYVSNKDRAVGIATPLILPHVGYGLENVIPGKRFLDNQETVEENRYAVAHWLGMHYAAGGIDMSERNAMIDEEPNLTRIDLELPGDFARSIGIHGTLYELNTMAHSMESWSDAGERVKLMEAFREGVHEMSERLSNPATIRVISEVADMAADDLRSTITPGKVEELKRMMRLSPEEKMCDLFFWAARAEEDKLYQRLPMAGGNFHRIDPVWHLGYVRELTRAISTDSPLDRTDLVDDRFPAHKAFGMFARLASLGFEGDTVRHLTRRGRPVTDVDPKLLTLLTSSRLYTLLRGYTEHVKSNLEAVTDAQRVGDSSELARQLCEDWGLNYSKVAGSSWGPHDTCKQMDKPRMKNPTDSSVVRVRVARQILELIRGSSKKIVPEDIEKEFSGLDDKKIPLNQFLEGFRIADEWLKNNRSQVLDYAGKAGLDVEGIQDDLDGDVEELIREGTTGPNGLPLGSLRHWLTYGVDSSNDPLKQEQGFNYSMEDQSIEFRLSPPLKKKYMGQVPELLRKTRLFDDVNYLAESYLKVGDRVNSLSGESPGKLERIMSEVLEGKYSPRDKSSFLHNLLVGLDRLGEGHPLESTVDSLHAMATTPRDERYEAPDPDKPWDRHDKLIRMAHNIAGDLAESG